MSFYKDTTEINANTLLIIFKGKNLLPLSLVFLRCANI